MAYSDLYLEDVAFNLGMCLSISHKIGILPKYFWGRFVYSFVAKEIEHGNPKYLVGCSELELFNLVLYENKQFSMCIFERDKYYWAGYSLAKYQHYSGLSFKKINRLVTIDDVLRLYNTLHEADITKFFSVMDEYIEKRKEENVLRLIRVARGYSQSQLAKEANVSIRNIQMYEQGKNNIKKAQADILMKIANALSCDIKDLIE